MPPPALEGFPSVACVGVLPLRHTISAAPAKYADCTMPVNWIWMQVAIVLFVAVGMIVAITKLA
ncbi:MAG TPA: hypothetical protein VGI76_03010 [Solirubrobacteraceae bacterium]|jgi:hypothetical protein